MVFQSKGDRPMTASERQKAWRARYKAMAEALRAIADTTTDATARKIARAVLGEIE